MTIDDADRFRARAILAVAAGTVLALLGGSGCASLSAKAEVEFQETSIVRPADPSLVARVAVEATWPASRAVKKEL